MAALTNSHTTNVRLPVILGALVSLPWKLKHLISTNRRAWRIYRGICTRCGWNNEVLGWHSSNNGPYAGIHIKATHDNHLWIPLGTYEPEVSQLLVALIKSDSVSGPADIWDVGANVGVVTLLC